MESHNSFVRCFSINTLDIECIKCLRLNIATNASDSQEDIVNAIKHSSVVLYTNSNNHMIMYQRIICCVAECLKHNEAIIDLDGILSVPLVYFPVPITKHLTVKVMGGPLCDYDVSLCCTGYMKPCENPRSTVKILHQQFYYEDKNSVPSDTEQPFVVGLTLDNFNKDISYLVIIADEPVEEVSINSTITVISIFGLLISYIDNLPRQITNIGVIFREYCTFNFYIAANFTFINENYRLST